MIDRLLNTLKELDPDTYNKWYSMTILCFSKNELVDLECHLSQYILQGCIQRAIEAKGLHWDITSWNVCDKKPEYLACISKIEPGFDGDYYNERYQSCINESSGDSIAEALLLAYYEVLKYIR